jgi:hypothetical protein
MKKFILTAVAAGALAVGGAASAQDLGGILGNIFGFGQPTYPTYGTSTPTPAVVAGTQQSYGGGVYVDQYGRQVDQYGRPLTIDPYGRQVDQYGRQVTIDQYGRQVLVQPNTGSYGITGYDQWGRPIYGTTTYGSNTYGSTTYGGTVYGSGYGARTWDRDGDGVANAQDRWPDDPRYH